MKKYLFVSFFLGTFCEVSFADVTRESSAQKYSAIPKTIDQMSDAELDRFMGRLVGETNADSEGVKWKTSNNREEIDEKRIERIEGAVEGSDSTDSRAFPTGFSLGIGIAQTWDVARNHTKVWYGQENGAGKEPYRHSDLLKFIKATRARLDPTVSVSYSFLFNSNVWIGVTGEVSFGSSRKHMGYYEGYKEECKIDGISYSAELKPGYLLREYRLIFYGILGMRWRKVRDEPKAEHLKISKFSQNKVMPVFGLGCEKQIAQNLSLSLEYEHYWRNSTFQKRGDDLKGEITMVARRGTASLRSNSVKLGLKYYF